MPEARGLSNALSMGSHEKGLQNHDGDFDFNEVLKACGDKAAPNMIRYPDGREEAFSFAQLTARREL